MKKGQIIENLVVETMAAAGKCVSRIDGMVIFLEGGAPGDVVDAQVTKIKKSFLEGRVTAVRQFSEDRTEPFCRHFGLCGGCTWQHIQYDTQLRYKQQQVVDNLQRIGGLDLPAIRPILPSGKTKYYRNKLDFTFTAQRWLTFEELDIRRKRFPDNPWGEDEPALGYHIPRKFDQVFEVQECFLQTDPSNAIRHTVKEEATKSNIPFFELRKQTGFLRTLTIRTANTGEVMIILQVADDKMEWIEKILGRLDRDFPEITSFNYVINAKKNDTFSDLKITCWKGNPYITERMSKPDGSGSLQFRIGPKSFYQTNSDQAYALYKVAWEMAQLMGNELVYDLYTGTGTIANFMAGHASRVVGLEYIAAAIDDARINAEINNITNTQFFAGDIKDLLDDAFLSLHGRPDTVITDPPRAGMHADVCAMLLKALPKKIVYVSCNPATQARDLALLSDQYAITAVQPVDMFPHTIHVENVVALQRR
ncbi:MAG: 23S rRNA (uracil(1939)-C(5))-methyltransferase RlmD [Cyclobacteriaceae bacterium]|nr:23S rRNA (uracil(1939)-C(5))-methyltransferase RlmD [Cyclobacteriaceae bacterium]MDH4296668.1 23S rRNA (uracil(1939)-C(5))-methyltransferase RlmD [Cyclobacteriaceae bacterium]MDH5250613.1 23S rRNA (uracil(1939)-C(5))-methyltransferase RlmD [Cyclobacteriaceae bacterium]